MDKLLVLAPRHSHVGEQVCRMLEGTYSVQVRHRAEDCISLLRRSPEIISILVDSPSKLPDTRALIDYVEHHNNDLYASCIILLTERSAPEEDLRYLGGVVVDCVRKPLNPTILRGRLETAQRLMRSVSFEELAELLTSLPSVIYLKDTHGRYIFASRSLHHLKVQSPDEVRGRTDLQLRRDKANALRAKQMDREMLRKGESLSYIIEEHSGEEKEYVQIIKAPVYYPDGRPRGVVGLVNDVTEMESLRRDLRRLSITDQLTGLYNRSYLEEYLTHHLKNSTFPVCIIMADCDNLKRMNDTYGHLAGDQYIRRCARLFQRCLPPGAAVFRMGGDEFMAIVPGMGDPQAKEYVEIIRRAVSACRVCGEALSISLGFSTMASRTFSFKTCMTIADDKMYQDKQEHKRARQD